MAPQEGQGEQQSATPVSTANIMMAPTAQTQQAQAQPNMVMLAPAAPPNVAYMMPGMPTMLYVYQPVSTCVWVSCQVPQPGAQQPVRAGEAIHPTARSGECSGAPRAVELSVPADGDAGASCQQSQTSSFMSTCCTQHESHDEDESDCEDGDGDYCEGYAQFQPVPQMTKSDSMGEASASVSTASMCSTAPSKQQRSKKQKQRPRPAQRQAAAQKHRRAMQQARSILQQKARFARELTAGGETSLAAIKELHGAVWHLALDSEGCRLVQLAVESAQGSERVRLVGGLRGHVREAMGSPHANYVIQKVIAVMPVELASFIAEELSGMAAEVCRHRYGCRILSRLIEQFRSSAYVSNLVDEMMLEICSLVQHTFGRFVVQAVLEHGSQNHRHIIAGKLAADMLNNATNRNASYVIESALKNCNDSDVAMLAASIADEDVIGLSQHAYGVYVVRSLMSLPGSTGDRVARQICMAPPAVQENLNFQRLQELLKEDVCEKTDDDDNSYVCEEKEDII